MSADTRILVVDDEPDLCEILRFNLESEGYEVECAYSAESALAQIGAGARYHLILLDVMMEHMSGYEMARQLRSNGDDIPIIFLTARDTESDLLEGFSSGGDDYIAKPFSFPTVLARIRAVLKRVPTDGTSGAARLQLDLQSHKAILDGAMLPLTKKEYLILELLMSQPRITHSREEIMRRVWEEDVFVGDRSVDVHIARLRKKLGELGANIVNHSGFGYAYEPQET